MSEQQDDRSIGQQIEALGLTGPRITPEHIEALMERVGLVCSHHEGTTTTMCHAFLDGRFFLGATYSACVSPENFDEELGIKIASGKAVAMVRDRLWELEGYRLYMQLTEPKAAPNLSVVEG